MSNEHWVRVAATGEISPGEGRVVETGGRALAVFNVEGTYYAIDNSCSHRGGPLGEGDLEGTVVVCPWHAWRWDVTSGAQLDEDRAVRHAGGARGHAPPGTADRAAAGARRHHSLRPA